MILEDRVTPYGIKVQTVEEVNKTEPKQPTAHLEGTKEVLQIIGGASGQDCKEYLAKCESGNKISCIKWGTNCRENDEVVAIGIKNEIKFKDEKLYLSDKEIKIMPETASQKAIETLELKKDVQIELKDIAKPTYEVIGKKDVKVFGFIKTEMSIKTEINAETGKIEKTKKPWWSFLTRE